ncbi:MAG: S16 family serine protease [Thermoplasmatota archaeon]
MREKTTPITAKKTHKTILLFTIILLMVQTISVQTTMATTPGEISNENISIEYRNVTVYAPAVGQTAEGYIGVISTVTVTIQNQGSGRVFVDTLPLAQIDMQGSARLAVKVASALVEKDPNCSVNPDNYDYFFVIRTKSPIIGGPSAGGMLTTAVVALLEGWDLDDQTVMTGMINPDGSIGPIGGITKKIDAANSVGATRFLIPEGQGTYTETIYETIQTAWGQQIVSHQVTRNVSDYAEDNYGIEVVEVADIKDVIYYYTGYEYEVTASNQSISTEQYIDSMKPLATNLLSQANQSYQNASAAFDENSIPNRFPSYYRNQVTDFLNNAEDAFTESQDWFNQELYYTSTSKSFQSLINSRFVTYACDYFNSSDQQTYLDTLLQEVRQYYSAQSEKAKNASVEGMITLQCVGAAQKRATEAAQYLNSAQNDYENSDFFSELYELAFTYQRSESIGWWLGLSDYFNDTGSISSTQLDDLASDYIDDAQQSIVYSQVILQELGSSSSLLSEAESMLKTAKQDKNNGYPAAALFEALEALSKGNLALELVDATTTEKIQNKLDRANESASASISESRLQGIEPLLAVSYYEYAESMIDDNVQNALFYYKYSDLIPGVLTYTGNCGTQSSRYVGIPEPSTSFFNLDLNQIGEYFIIFAFIGGLAGIAIGIIIGKLIGKDKKPEKKPYTWTPYSIHDYQEKRPPQDYSFRQQLPQNINDYFNKENKYK